MTHIEVNEMYTQQERDKDNYNMSSRYCQLLSILEMTYSEVDERTGNGHLPETYNIYHIIFLISSSLILSYLLQHIHLFCSYFTSLKLIPNNTYLLN